MKTYKIYTFSHIITVKNCTSEDEAILKTGLSREVIFKVELVK